MEKLSRTGKRLESTSRSLLESMYSLEFEKKKNNSFSKIEETSKSLKKIAHQNKRWLSRCLRGTLALTAPTLGA